MFRTITRFPLALALLAAPAFAGNVALDHAIQAGSLHEGGVDMVAYYTDATDGALEVTATFAARTSDATPMRVVMALNDGDATRFGLPDHRGTSYAFARHGETVVISVSQDPKVAATPATSVELANNDL